MLWGLVRAGWGQHGLVAPFCTEGTALGWHGWCGTAWCDAAPGRWPRGAQRWPGPRGDVQMFPGTPLAAACVLKVMNFCTN